MNPVDKSSAASPASGTTNISSLGSATSWSSHMKSFVKLVADEQEEQPLIQTAPSPPPKPNSYPQVKTYTKAKRGRGGSQRGARRGRANPRKSALPITSSSSTPPTGRRSLPLSTPSPTEWQLQLERSQPSIPSGKEADATPSSKIAMAVDDEPMRPFTPAACEDMSILGEPVQQSTPQLLAPRMKISFIQKGKTVPKKPVIVRRKRDEPVATFTLLGSLERLPSPKPTEGVISTAIQTEETVLVSTATQSEENVATRSVEVQTDLELIFSPKATAKAQDSLETVSQPSTFVLEKETTDAVSFSDSDDSLREAFKSADHFYKRSRRLSSDCSGDVPSSKRSRSSPPPPAVESLDQFYSPLKTDQIVDEDSIPSAQKTVVAESDQEDDVMSATPPGTQRKVLCYSGLTVNI